MNKDYKTIKLYAGCSIEIAVAKLLEYKERGELACCNFNDHMLYSDNVTVDSAYLEIVGMTKEEFDKEQKRQREEDRKKEEAYKTKIPELTKEWIEKGHEVLDEKYWFTWDNYVPIRLSDLYHGTELGCCLDIIEPLNNGCLLEEAKRIIDEQGHSGMSYSLVRVMVSVLCDRGVEFANYIGY